MAKMEPFGSSESLHAGITQNASTVAANNRAAANRSTTRRGQDMEFEKFLRTMNVQTGLNVATNADEASEDEITYKKAFEVGNAPVERVGQFMGDAYKENQSMARDAAVKQITDSTFMRQAQAQRVMAENNIANLAKAENIDDLNSRVLASAYGLQTEVERRKFMAAALGEGATAAAMKRAIVDPTAGKASLISEPGMGLDLGDNRFDYAGQMQFGTVNPGLAFRGIEDQDEANKNFRDLVDAANYHSKNFGEKVLDSVTGFGRLFSGIVITPPMQRVNKNLKSGGYLGPAVRARVTALYQLNQINQSAGQIAKDVAKQMGVAIDDPERLENISSIAGDLMGKISRTFAHRSRDAHYVQENIYRATEDDEATGQSFANFMTRATGQNFDNVQGKETGRSYENDYQDLRTQIEQYANVPSGAGDEHAEDVRLALQIVGNMGYYLRNSAAENVINQGNFEDMSPEGQAKLAESKAQMMASTGYSEEEVNALHKEFAHAKLEEGQVYKNFGAAVNEVLGNFHIQTDDIQQAANVLQSQLTDFKQIVDDPNVLMDTSTAMESILQAANATKSKFVPMLGERGLLSGQLRQNANSSDIMNPTRESLTKMRNKYLARAKTYYDKGRMNEDSLVESLFDSNMTLPEQMMMIGAVNEVTERKFTLGKVQQSIEQEAQQSILEDIARVE